MDELSFSNKKDSEKKVEWIELFYDLGFVAAVVAFASEFDLSRFNFYEFNIALAALWWAWLGFVFYSSRFGTSSRLVSWLTVIKIIGVCGMGLAAHLAPSQAVIIFSASYILLRIVLLWLYILAYNEETEISAKLLVRDYLMGFGLALFPWMLIFIMPQYWSELATIGIIIDLMTPILIGIKRVQKHPPDLGHLSERFALFYLIVLGEVFISVVNTVPSTLISWSNIFLRSLAIVMTYCLWIIYSNNQKLPTLNKLDQKTQFFVYLHFPLMVSTFYFVVGLKSIFGNTTNDFSLDKFYLFWGGLLGVLICIKFVQLSRSGETKFNFVTLLFLLFIISNLIFQWLPSIQSSFIFVTLFLILIVICKRTKAQNLVEINLKLKK